MTRPFGHFDQHSYEPQILDLDELRQHRKERLALAYRAFGHMGWGTLGDGHITARDPRRPDCFWLARFGVPFGCITVNDLVLVGPHGDLVDGEGGINMSAYYIHHPLHEARPDVVSAAHCHTPYGTPFSSLVTYLEPMSQESCVFFGDHEIFDDEEVDITSTDGGRRIAQTLGQSRAVILRNHGLVTVGESVDAAIGFFALMERCAEVQLKAAYAGGGKPISAAAARQVHDAFGDRGGWQVGQWLVRTTTPDQEVVC